MSTSTLAADVVEGCCLVTTIPFETLDDVITIYVNTFKPIQSHFALSYAYMVNLVERGGGWDKLDAP